MSDIEKILETAQARAQETGLPYKGALLPTEAYALAQTDPNAKIIDVRSQAELDWVGRIPGATETELLTYPGMQPNDHFLAQLTGQIKDKKTPLFFICRTGVRSDQAANLMHKNGFTNCYNILEGFEGGKDEEGHRGQTSGWKAAGLPWTQR